MTAHLSPPPAELELADRFCRRLSQRHYENFTVTSAFLPGELRVHLARIYAYCRVTDDLGDEGGPPERLTKWRAEVEAALREGAVPLHPVLLALRETVTVCAIPVQPFLDLIDANVQDQTVRAYQTWPQLAAYCRLSAAPVGRMVLAVLGLRGERAEQLSDSVCTGLQLANFAQDVSVDTRRGRCYLIEDEIYAHGRTGAIRALCERAQTLLDAGRELESRASPRLRTQLALYRLGGLAIIDAVRRAGFRTDLSRPQVSTGVKLRLAAEALVVPRRRRETVDANPGDIVVAQRHCRSLARRHAANFYWGFVALPITERTAIYALYDFARQVDDAVDCATGADPRSRLDEHRQRVRRALAGEPDDEIMAVLARAVVRHRIPVEELDALIDGVGMDLTSTRYQSWEELAGYCRLVASVVGRMCVRIFGFDSDEALDRADDLGLAMQLTNILRDVRADFEIGRVYLPQDELRAFGVAESQFASEIPGPGWEELVRHQARRARHLFAGGLEVDRHIPRRAAICVRTLAGIYLRILDEIEREPQLPLRRRISLSAPSKATVLLRAALPRHNGHVPLSPEG